MDEALLEKVLARASRDFGAFCEAAGLEPPSGPIDKYGSYVFEAGQWINGLNRYIALALTSGAGGSIRVECQMAADDGTRYIAETGPIGYVESVFARDLAEGLGPNVSSSLLGFWQIVVLRFTREQLTKDYVVPRSEAEPLSIDASR
jgi:hypothetical protein